MFLTYDVPNNNKCKMVSVALPHPTPQPPSTEQIHFHFCSCYILNQIQSRGEEERKRRRRRRKSERFRASRKVNVLPWLTVNWPSAFIVLPTIKHKNVHGGTDFYAIKTKMEKWSSLVLNYCFFLGCKCNNLRTTCDLPHLYCNSISSLSSFVLLSPKFVSVIFVFVRVVLI